MEHCIVVAFLGLNAISDILRREICLFSIGIFMIAAIVYQGLILQNIAAILPGLLPGAALLVLSRVTREALGLGDGLLVLVLGSFLGLNEALDVLLLALFFAAVWAGILLLIRKKHRDYEFPFVPFVLAGYLGRWLLEIW